MKLSKPQTALFGVGMIVASPVLATIAAVVAVALYFAIALACVLMFASVRIGSRGR